MKKISNERDKKRKKRILLYKKAYKNGTIDELTFTFVQIAEQCRSMGFYKMADAYLKMADIRVIRGKIFFDFLQKQLNPGVWNHDKRKRV